ncbi:MAG: hypothetical protein H6667_26015 [Ardenticatenaceae bacterium]|nr:hypothetical protein [Ardenticatenaceae bacterium]
MQASPAFDETVQGVDGGTAVTGTITFTADYGAGTDVNPLLLGSNLLAWLASDDFSSNSTFVLVPRSWASILSVCRGGVGAMPTIGSPAKEGVAFDGNAVCWWIRDHSPPISSISPKPSAGRDGGFINQAGIAQSEAPCWSLFKLPMSDTRVIGADVRGRDWGRG